MSVGGECAYVCGTCVWCRSVCRGGVMSMPVYIWRPAEILLLFSITLPHSLKTGSFTKIGARPAAWKPQWSSCLCLLGPPDSTGMHVTMPRFFFLYLYWDLNSDPHAFIASRFTHSTVSLAPRTRIFLNYWKGSKIHDRNYYTEICLEYISLRELGIQGCCHVAPFTFDGQYFYSRIWGYFIL